MRILVTGASGQLGLSLKKVQPKEHEVIYATRSDLDVCDAAAIAALLATHKVSCVINCAAYTKVDAAENEPEAALAANATAVETLAKACRQHDVFLIHVSTDFLFHGAFNRPIAEDAIAQPIGVYAKTKAQGETAFFASRCRGSVVRTSWLYSEFRTNFMKTILRLGRERTELKIIADQHGSPTYAVDLARALWLLAERQSSLTGAPEIFHFCNWGVTTWYDFAYAILDLAGIDTPVIPILTHEYPLPTPRPAYSALWPRKFSNQFEFKINNWRTALKEAVHEGEKL